MSLRSNSSREVNTHYVITVLFNPLFNSFITKHIGTRAIERVVTKGLFDIESRGGPLYNLAFRLDLWRLDLIRKGVIPESELENEVEKLIGIYRDAKNLIEEGELSVHEISDLSEVLQKIPEFLGALDDYLGANFFLGKYAAVFGRLYPREIRGEHPQGETPTEERELLRGEPIRCGYCGKPIEGMPFTCSHCRGVFCVYHHLPEKHECPELPRIRRPRVEGMFTLPYPTRRLRTTELEEDTNVPVVVRRKSTTPTLATPSERKSTFFKETLKAVAIAVLVAVALLLQSLRGWESPPPLFVEPVAGKKSIATDLSSPAVSAAFNELNRIRREHGLPTVSFVNLKVAEHRVKYMYEENLFSHYDRQGLHPAYYFALLDGGIAGFEENAAATICLGTGCRLDPIENSAKSIWGMVYDDASSSWGHRDSLLDPCNNKVAIAAAWDGDRFYMVVHMVSEWIEWVSPPSYSGGVFSFKGYVRLPPPRSSGFYYIFIYKDVPSPAYVNRHSYDYGTLYAGVLPQDRGYYPGLRTIYASRYILKNTGTSWYVEVEFPLHVTESGVYTIIMLSENVGIEWQPKSPLGNNRKEMCQVMTYSFRK